MSSDGRAGEAEMVAVSTLGRAGAKGDGMGATGKYAVGSTAASAKVRYEMSGQLRRVIWTVMGAPLTCSTSRMISSLMGHRRRRRSLDQVTSWN